MDHINWDYVLQVVTAALILGCLGMLKSSYTVLIQLKTWSTDHEKLDDARFEALKKTRSMKRK